MEREPCGKCKIQIDVEAEVCPHCGYDPQKNGRFWRKAFVIIGMLLTLSIVGSPVGIPMLLAGLFAERKIGQKTAATA